MTYTERALELRPVMEQAAQSLPDDVALTAVELFPQWDKLVKTESTVDIGFRFQYGIGEDGQALLWRTEQPKYTFVKTYVPGEQGTESLFSRVDKTHAGTLEDPIPYDRNMEIYEGLYYSQNGVTYLCTRSSGQPLYNDLSALVGHYVEVAG